MRLTFAGADQSDTTGHTYKKAYELFWSHLGLTPDQRSWVMGGTAAKLFSNLGWRAGPTSASL